MRILKKLIVAVACTVFALSIKAQTHKVKAYFNATEMPNMLKWGEVITPPEKDSETFIYDIKQYYRGKELRLNPERAAIAIRDANFGLNTIIKEFSIPFGMQISWKNTPEIYALLRTALATTDSICKLPKAYYMRPRPFMVFNEPTLTPDDESNLRNNGSWPSGHSILGWSAALILSEINPARTDTIVARGLIYGQSRVVCGVHWQSDVDAGRIAASVAYAKLHTNERFLKQMASAKKEFMTLKDKYPPTGNNEFSNDPIYKEHMIEYTNMQLLEQKYRCKIQKFTFGFDETFGLKILYIKTNESPYNVSNGIDHVILTNEKNEIVYVAKAVLRHDKEVDSDESIYGLYVVGKEREGEIEISYHDYYNLTQLLFQNGKLPEFLNCSTIRYQVASVANFIPFRPVSTKNRKLYHRFFSD